MSSPFGRTNSRPRRGVSMIEILVAMTLLVVVLGAMSVLTTRTVKRSRELDLASARTFVIMQESNRFASMPYTSIPTYATGTDDIITAGRYQYKRRVSFTQSNTGSEYRIVKVLLMLQTDTLKRDSLVFQRGMMYARSPLFK